MVREQQYRMEIIMNINFLQGYKTYCVATLAIIGAIVSVLTGDATIANALSIIVPSILSMTVRSGITTEMNKGN